MHKLLMVFILSFPIGVMANDGPKPPKTISSIGIMEAIGKHYFDYSHFKITGACVWLKCEWTGCHINTTMELDEYIPDLVVTSYNGKGNDPWEEANDSIDSVGYAAGNAAVKAATGFTMTNGRNRAVSHSLHEDRNIVKSVDVIGSPFDLLEYPFPILSLDTVAYNPYYQSDLDALMDRSDIAEGIRPETYMPYVNYIGPSAVYHWGYEFPRSMINKTSNDYKAAVMAALHAADIVTNKNTLHVVQSTSDSCGENCSVANVIEEIKDDHEIWQEVYPKDKHIQLGENDVATIGDLGANDDEAGNGNYVFVVWRHYKGCQQAEGDLIYSTQHISPTQKR